MNLKTATICAAAALAFSLNTQASNVYSNTNNDLNINYSIGNMKVGDELVLGGTDRFVTHFDLQYYANNFNGNETLTVWLYLNDGPSIVLNNRTAQAPGTELFSGSISLVDGLVSTPRSTINFDSADFLGGGISVPSGFNLTLALQFSGVGAGESAGVTLYNPPTMGSNFNTYWEFDGSDWGLVTNVVGDVTFGASISAVPEPSTISIVLMGGLLALGGRRFLGKK